MVGWTAKLMTQLETRVMFKHDPVFQGLINDEGLDPRALELTFGALASAAVAEIGSAMTAEFNGSSREKSTILCLTRALTPGSSYFSFYVIDSSAVITQYYGWFSKQERFTIVCDTRVNTPGSSSFAFTLGATTYYGWFSKKEVFTVTCLDAASTTTGTYFTFTDSEAVPTSYYVWLDKNGDGTTDDPGAAGTGVACNISAATTASDVATIVAAAVNGLGGAVSGAVAELVTVTMATKGDPTDAVDVDSGYTVTVTENGGADPSGTGTGAEFDISGATTADDIGVIVAGIINALASAASNTTGTVTVIATANGQVADAVDVDSGYVITVTEQGGTDPSATGTGAEFDISGATSAGDVATIVQGIIDALSDVTATVATATVTVSNDETGTVTKITDFNTTYVITQVQASSAPYGGAPLYVFSAGGDDIDNIAKDMRKNTIIGYYKDANGKTILEAEEVNLAGVTLVKTTIDSWIRAIHHGGSDWGTAGQNAKANISLSDINSTVYLVITAATNESEGGVIWIPNDFHALIAEWSLAFNDIALTTAGDGVQIKVSKYGLDDTKNNRLYNREPDNADLTLNISRENPSKKEKWPTKSKLHGTDVGKLTFYEGAVNTQHSFIFKAYVLLWYKANPTT